MIFSMEILSKIPLKLTNGVLKLNFTKKYVAK